MRATENLSELNFERIFNLVRYVYLPTFVIFFSFYVFDEMRECVRVDLYCRLQSKARITSELVTTHTGCTRSYTKEYR